MVEDELGNANAALSRDRLRQRPARHEAIIACPRVFASSEAPPNVFCKESSSGASSRASKSRAAFSFFAASRVRTGFAAGGFAASGGIEVEASVMFMRLVSVVVRRGLCGSGVLPSRDGAEPRHHTSTTSNQVQITSRSASSAPAALMACTIEITSRAVAPMLCSPPPVGRCWRLRQFLDASPCCPWPARRSGAPFRSSPSRAESAGKQYKWSKSPPKSRRAKWIPPPGVHLFPSPRFPCAR